MVHSLTDKMVSVLLALVLAVGTCLPSMAFADVADDMGATDAIEAPAAEEVVEASDDVAVMADEAVEEASDEQVAADDDKDVTPAESGSVESAPVAPVSAPLPSSVAPLLATQDAQIEPFGAALASDDAFTPITSGDYTITAVAVSGEYSWDLTDLSSLAAGILTASGYDAITYGEILIDGVKSSDATRTGNFMIGYTYKFDFSAAPAGSEIVLNLLNDITADDSDEVVDHRIHATATIHKADPHASCLAHSKSGWCIDANGHCDVPAGATSIPNSEFSSITALKSVAIPDSVTSIGSCAFQACSNLSGVLPLPSSLISIGFMAFYGCESITSVTIPDGIKTIGNYTFMNCSVLSSVTIPDSVTSIGKQAFHQCYELEYYDQVQGLTPSQLDALSVNNGDVNNPTADGAAFDGFKIRLAVTEWTVITDGNETTIEVPEGELPVEGEDFTVPEREGYTPDVKIDEQNHTVKITYTRNMVEWAVMVDNVVNSTFMFPEGELPVEGADFTIPERDGYTANVCVFENIHQVWISYIRNVVEWTVLLDGQDYEAAQGGVFFPVDDSGFIKASPEQNITTMGSDTNIIFFCYVVDPVYSGYLESSAGVSAAPGCERLDYSVDYDNHIFSFTSIRTWTIDMDGTATTIELPEGKIPVAGEDYIVPQREGYTPAIDVYDDTVHIAISYIRNLTEWKIVTDGDESSITIPEGKLPIEDEDFTVPEKDGYTPSVTIDEDNKTVTITYTKDETPEPVVPVDPTDPVDPTEPDEGDNEEVVVPPVGNDENGDENDNEGGDKAPSATGKPTPVPSPAPEAVIEPNDTPQAGIDASDDDEDLEEIVEPMLIPESLIVAPDSDSDAAVGDENADEGNDANKDDKDADSAANIEENKIPLSDFDAPEPSPFPWMNILAGILSGFLALFFLLLLLLWKRGKWTLMSEGLSDDDATIKCRKDEDAIEKKLEDFEVPTVAGYKMSQRVIDEDDKKVVYYYTAE